MPTYLSTTELNDALTIRDLSDPCSGPHAMQTLLQAVSSTLSRKWDVAVRVIRHSPLVSVVDNYDHLGFHDSDVTRDQKYSRYVSPTVMLRSHTSASIPSLLRALDSGASTDELWAIPGLVYRRDSIDRTHIGTPHQLDLWRVSSQVKLDVGDLQDMISALVQAVLPVAEWRAVPAIHPYPDIRLLRSTDRRIEEQMKNLEPWRPVSQMPPIRRDISIVVPADMDAEVLGDRVRTALNRRADDLESVELLAITAQAELPVTAQERLQIREGQANALIRLVLRPLTRTMTDPQANQIRDDVYLALHEGPVKELIAG